jgi:large subunit ribosomal protein L25
MELVGRRPAVEGQEMFKDILVDVTSRAERGTGVARRLRRGGQIPAVVYGMNKPPVPVAVDPKIIDGILTSDSGENTVFQLRLDGHEDKRRHVMIREQQSDPVSGRLVHVDFLRVDMDKEVEVEVPLETVGIADGVKNQGGLLDFVVRSVQVSCMPADIPGHFAVDVTPLGVGDVFRVKDLEQDPKIRMLTDPQQALVVISGRPAEEEAEEEAAAAAEAAEAAEPAAEEAPSEGGEAKE